MDAPERKPLARMTSEKYRPRTVKMPDSLWERFTAAALASRTWEERRPPDEATCRCGLTYAEWSAKQEAR